MNDLHGKVAIVTGASKGIGAGIAKAMAAAGAAVTINYATDKDGANRVLEEITRGGGKAIAVQGDVSRAADAKRIVDATMEEFGALTTLVNNAAYFTFDPLDAITEEAFHRHFNTNVLGALLMTKEAVRRFAPGACVINVGSAGTMSPTPNAALYSASKAALDMITQVLAKELGPRNIRVNSLWPGVTETEGNRISAMGEPIARLLTEKTALQRVGLPSDVAPAAVFLASDDAAWVTAAILNASGGFR